jgi:large subunit ribosomal protein L18
MAQGPKYKVKHRRRRQGKTDYRMRVALLKSQLPRAVVRKSLKSTHVQIIDFDFKGDKVLASANACELEKFGWSGSHSNLPTAYLTGYLAGKRAIKAGVNEAVLDIGLNRPIRGSRIFASLKGLIDSGLQIPHDDSILPKEERIKGQHLKEDKSSIFETTKNKLEEEK